MVGNRIPHWIVHFLTHLHYLSKVNLIFGIHPKTQRSGGPQILLGQDIATIHAIAIIRPSAFHPAFPANKTRISEILGTISRIRKTQDFGSAPTTPYIQRDLPSRASVTQDAEGYPRERIARDLRWRELASWISCRWCIRKCGVGRLGGLEVMI